MKKTRILHRNRKHEAKALSNFKEIIGGEEIF